MTSHYLEPSNFCALFFLVKGPALDYKKIAYVLKKRDKENWKWKRQRIIKLPVKAEDGVNDYETERKGFPASDD